MSSIARSNLDFLIGGGTFGQIATKTLLSQKRTQYPNQYRASDFEKQLGKRVHDCVGLIKGYLWTNDNGKIVYNPSQDKDVSGMLQNCNEIGNITSIPEIAGVLVFMQGHVGVYIGNGEVIEAKGHAYGVVKTKLKERPWKTYGKLKWIIYEEDRAMEKELTMQEKCKEIQRIAQLDDNTGLYLQMYRYNTALIDKLYNISKFAEIGRKSMRENDL